MNVYVDNLLAGAAELSAGGLAPGFDAGFLYDEALSNGAAFAGTEAEITARWGLNRFADAVAILGSNWTTGRLAVFSQGEAVYDAEIASAGAHTVVAVPPCMVSEVVLTLRSVDPLRVGMLFVGRRLALPRFGQGAQWKVNVNGKGERTRHGMAYGEAMPSLRSLDLAFRDLDDAGRRTLEDYIDVVQFVRPHLVEPWDPGAFPPLYATLVGGGDFTKSDRPGFRWDTALSYMEAR